MIVYFPEIYPDELVYSWFCRCFVHSGFCTHKMALDEILFKRHNNLSKEFLGRINPDIQKQIQVIVPIKKLILEHTMFSQYGRFIPLEQKEKALYHLEYDYCDAHYLFSILPRAETDKSLKYCPLCSKEDKAQYGETYWHRKHQIRGVTICYKHKCNLYNSTVTAKSEQTFTFNPADEYAINTTPQTNYNEALQHYTEYITAVFDTSIDFEKSIPISAILYNAMRTTKYIKWSIII